MNIFLLLILGLTSYSTNATTYFQTYGEARDSFRQRCEALQSSASAVPGKFQVPSHVDSDLTIDSCYIPATKSDNGMVVITSGIHGVEGHLGSAVMELFFEKVFDRIQREQTSILLVHSLNPFGHKYHRRVTENNVDLCRNFAVSPDLFRFENTSYDQFYDFLNPKGKADTSMLTSLLSYTQMGMYIAQYGISSLRQSILQGQFKHEQGLYFGGLDFEPQFHFFKGLIEKYGDSPDKIFHIDIHTGYGNRGQLHFFPNPVPDRLVASFKKVFEGFDLDIPEKGGDFYETKGDISTFVIDMFPHKKVVSLAFEYGTSDNLGTLGGIRSLNIMRNENQGYHYGYQSQDDEQSIRHYFMEHYNPSDANYRESVLLRTEVVLPIVIENFQQLSSRTVGMVPKK